MKFQHFGLRSEIKIGCRKVERGWEGGGGREEEGGMEGQRETEISREGEIIMDKCTIQEWTTVISVVLKLYIPSAVPDKVVMVTRISLSVTSRG